ncbi:MAG TPA: efflux transporter outer membrane subunit [Caldimonas sp.]|nr:efflux transporter outer membrane subunit [Caldimonas sp.]HEX2541327.1 efflux transporter outer membrane subunit [Caldimonas sp.]
MRRAGSTPKPALVGAFVVALGLAGCVAGPDYVRPQVEVPPSWQIEAPWREGRPADAAPKGAWWEHFGDRRLDALQQQALARSPTLALASARLEQARAVVRAQSSGLLPTVSLGARAARARISANRPLTNYDGTNVSTVQNDGVLSLSVGYEFDLAGRVQRTIEGVQASAQQSAADFENTRLLLGTDLATAYFNLRAVDIEIDVLTRSLALQRRSLDFVTTRRDLGAASGLDVAQQQALLSTTLTQLELLRRQRGPFEHAIATLTGTPAPSFRLAPDITELVPPAVPVGVPSDVLERRPDVASAERAMAAANAQVGIARAAYYPSITIAPSVGVQSRTLADLFEASSLLWSIGASVAQPIFNGGRLAANEDFARANYDATVASYRRVVLTAMQEVEDGISGLVALERATAQSRAAVAAAGRVLELATARYELGATTYLDVITAQQSLLAAERLAAQLVGQRLLTSVFLIKALGGGWA